MDRDLNKLTQDVQNLEKQMKELKALVQGIDKKIETFRQAIKKLGMGIF